jgi:hypothetical protein
VDEDDLKNILTNKQFLRYQQFFLLASLRNDPTVRWCPRYVVGPSLVSLPRCSLCCVA